MSFMDKAKDLASKAEEDKAHEAVGKLDDDGPTPPSDPGA